MNHQDDLESDFKAASNEQPSAETDQLILQAAADALKEASTEQVNTKAKNVILGRFATHRWQTPVSIAAVALITFSFVNTYSPWLNKDMDTLLPEPVILEEQEAQAAPLSKTNKIMIDSDSINEQKIQSKSVDRQPQMMRQRVAKKASATDTSTQLEVVSEKLVTVTGSRIVNKPLMANSPVRPEMSSKLDEKSEESQTEFAAELSADDLAVGSISIENPASSLSDKVKAKNKPQLPIDLWLSKLEISIREDKLQLAQADKILMIHQHPLQSFSAAQLLRYDAINKQLTSE